MGLVVIKMALGRDFSCRFSFHEIAARSLVIVSSVLHSIDIGSAAE
jgi:hypothetical protein